jgi:hypothetical protein
LGCGECCREGGGGGEAAESSDFDGEGVVVMMGVTAMPTERSAGDRKRGSAPFHVALNQKGVLGTF